MDFYAHELYSRLTRVFIIIIFSYYSYVPCYEVLRACAAWPSMLAITIIVFVFFLFANILPCFCAQKS